MIIQLNPTVHPSGEKQEAAEAITPTSPPNVVKGDYQLPCSDSDSGTDSDLEQTSDEEPKTTPQKPLKKRKLPGEGVPVKKRATPQHVLAEWMYDKYPILQCFATAPSDVARHLYKYRYRVCMVENFLKTNGPLEILRHL